MRVGLRGWEIVTFSLGVLALLGTMGCGQGESASDSPAAPRVTAALTGREIEVTYEIPTDESQPDASFMVLTARDPTPRGSPIGKTITLSGSTGRVALLRPPTAGPYTLLASTLTKEGHRSAVVTVPVAGSETTAPLTR